MKGVHGTHKVSKLASEDVISSMPENVITNIMNRLPIRDAVRTGILSRNWRLNWTLLTELVVCNISKYLQGPDRLRYYDDRIITRLLLHLKGPVTKFVLCIPDDQILDVENLDHWVLFLSRKGIKEFHLDYVDSPPLKMPTHLFTCLQLTHLKLESCYFHPPPTFCGFPNLLSLDLINVICGSYRCVEFLTRCPLLEILNIACNETPCNVNLVDIATLKNLKMLSLPLGGINDTAITMSSIFQLVGSLPKLEELNFDLVICKFVVEGFVRNRIPTTFRCLKTLALLEVDFCRDDMLSCALEIICGFPYLQKLKITGGHDFYIPPEAVNYSDLVHLDSNTMKHLQLQRVVFANFGGLENEVYLIKYILACSPLLKTVAISSSRWVFSDDMLMIVARNLLKFHRASPVAEVDFN